MSNTPGYVSNSDLALRLSTLVDRWNRRENQMIALLTQEEGTVIVTDGLGVNHELPSFPQLQKDVTAMTDELTGVLPQVQDVASVVTSLASAAEQAAHAAEQSALDAAASAEDTGQHVAASAASAAEASSSADAAAASATAAATSADEAETSATEAATYASEAEQHAGQASSSASAAATAETQAQAHASDAAVSAQEAANHAQDTSGHSQAAESARQDAEQFAAAAEDAAVEAESHASLAEASAVNAAASEAAADSARAQAASHSGSAATSANASADYAAAAAASAANAADRAIDAAQAGTVAEDARDLANLYANAPRDTEIAPGEFSARHWAEVATQIATGALVYMGTWDASTSFPVPAEVGHLYRVSAPGDTGGIDWNIGDQALFNGEDWEKIDNTDSVKSVAGKQGNVELVAGDIEGLGDLATRNTVEWNTHIAGRPSAFPPESHTHSWPSITERPYIPTSQDFVATSGNQQGLSGTKEWTSTHTWSGAAQGVFTKTANTNASLVVERTGATSRNAHMEFRTESHSVFAGIGNISDTIFCIGTDVNLTSANTAFQFNTANGIFFASGEIRAPSMTINGNQVWHEGSFDPSSKANLGSNTFTDTQYLDTTSSGARKIVLRNPTTGAHAGMRVTNTPTLYLFTDGGGSVQLRPDGETSTTGMLSVSSTNATLRGTRIPIIFVQSGNPGSNADDGDLWVW